MFRHVLLALSLTCLAPNLFASANQDLRAPEQKAPLSDKCAISYFIAKAIGWHGITSFTLVPGFVGMLSEEIQNLGLSERTTRLLCNGLNRFTLVNLLIGMASGYTGTLVAESCHLYHYLYDNPSEPTDSNPEVEPLDLSQQPE